MLINDNNTYGVLTIAYTLLTELHERVFGSKAHQRDDRLGFLTTPGRVVAVVPGLIRPPSNVELTDQQRQHHQELERDFLGSVAMFDASTLAFGEVTAVGAYLLNGENFKEHIAKFLSRAFFERNKIRSVEECFGWLDSPLLAVIGHEIRHEWQTLNPERPWRTFQQLDASLQAQARQVEQLRTNVMRNGGPGREENWRHEEDAIATELLIQRAALNSKYSLAQRLDKAAMLIRG